MLRQIITLILLLSVTCFARIWDINPLSYKINRFHQGQFHSEIDLKTRDFVVLLPENYDPEKESEIIYFLAGGEGKAAELPRQLETQETRLQLPFFKNKIWVALGMSNYGMWSNNKKELSSDIFFEFLNYFESHVKHTDVRNLVGHSLGGAGAFHFAFEYSEYFKRIAAVSAPILMWNIFDATPEMISDYVRDHAPKTPLNYFSFIVNEMKNDFGSREAYATYDIYNRILSKQLPACFALLMGDADPMGFAYLAHEFNAFLDKHDKNMNYVEQVGRDHSISSALDDVASYFESCSN